MTDLTITVRKTVQAPIEKVFDAWLDPETLPKFIIPMKGMAEPEVVNEPHVGGKFTIIMRPGNEPLPHTGEYIEISRPNKLIFTWVSDHSVEGSTVTLDFTEIDQSTTEVLLTHVKFLDEQAKSDHKGGWTSILEELGNYMEG